MLMRPGSWTELFFLDEATAFAAGHRPCAFCRRARFTEFKTAWVAANPTIISSAAPRIAEIDNVLHAERIRKGGGKVTYEEEWQALPDGAMIELNATAYMVWRQRLLTWSFDGYLRDEIPYPVQRTVHVLTPASVIRTFRNGFLPNVHASAQIQ
jgi:hypothetical protein